MRPAAEISPHYGEFVNGIHRQMGFFDFENRPSVEQMTLRSSDARLIREHIAKTRRDRKIIGAKLSESLDKGQKYISRVETGEIETPPLETLADIAGHLDSPLSYLFFTDGYGETAEEIREKIQRLIAIDDIEQLRRYYRLLLVAREKF